MPTYDYYCKKCDREFSLTRSIGEHEKAKTTCPKCKSKSVAQLITGFSTVTSRKS